MRAQVIYSVIILIAACGVYCEIDGNNLEDNHQNHEINGNISSIRIRVTTNDRELCSVLNLQHPFYPKCQDYCAKLGHWIGMCRKKQFCYCYK